MISLRRAGYTIHRVGHACASLGRASENVRRGLFGRLECCRGLCADASSSRVGPARAAPAGNAALVRDHPGGSPSRGAVFSKDGPGRAILLGVAGIGVGAAIAMLTGENERAHIDLRAQLEHVRPAGTRRAPEGVDIVLSSTDGVEPLHLPRAIDEELRGLVFKETGLIYILQGPQGAGKSQAIRAAVGRQPGAIFVSVGAGETLFEAIAEQLRKLGAEKVISHLDVEKALRQAIAIKRQEPGVPQDWVPTLVVEVDPDFSVKDVDVLTCDVKRLASDKKLCSPFVIFTDMGTALHTDNIGGRARQLCVPELSLEEVDRLAEMVLKAGKLHESMSTPEQRLDFVRNHGTLANAVMFGLIGTPPEVPFGGRAAAALWNCEDAPSQRASVRALLTKLALKYERAKEEAAAVGKPVRVDEVVLNSDEAGMLDVELADTMALMMGSRAVHVGWDTISFIHPAAAEEALQLVRGS